VEVAGAALGLATVDLVEVAGRLTVVGDQGQVEGQPLAVCAQRLGQMTGECGVEPPLQFGVVGQRGQQCLARRLVAGGVFQALAGIGQRGDPSGGGQQQRPEDVGGGLALVVPELEVGLQVLCGESVDLVAVEGMMVRAHGSLR
jgi:hypothetical protein